MGKQKLHDFDRNIAIVGLGGSGKSVFLTSLIDHIRNPESMMMVEEWDRLHNNGQQAG